MDSRTQRLLDELTKRWLALDPVGQELLIAVIRRFGGDTDLSGLENYQAYQKQRWGETTESQETLDQP